MITQQELINRLNHLTLRYNLTWPDIKYDADKAIAKINAFMGTKYPKMSSVMLAPHNGYTLNSGGSQIEIFPDEYMHSIVIPYIAMEVLARDEEFTTIYNKYSAELEDGLFTMFQKEFNRVPMVFRQDNDQGVFFAEETSLAKVARNLQENLPTFKFKIHYHINNDAIVLSSLTCSHFLEDNRAYNYEEEAEIQGWNIKLLSFKGTIAYTFKGWVLDKTQVIEDDAYVPGTKVAMKSDLHLYAKWEETSTLHCTSTGVVSIKAEFAKSLTYLEIPNYINNILVREIPSYFCTKNVVDANIDTSNLETIVLPSFLVKLHASAFSGFSGSAIIFQETMRSTAYDGITIMGSAFATTPKLTDILLPANIKTIYSGAFPVVPNKALIIRCRLLRTNVKEWDGTPGEEIGWHPNWYAASSEGSNYTVDVVWGYNG